MSDDAPRWEVYYTPTGDSAEGSTFADPELAAQYAALLNAAYSQPCGPAPRFATRVIPRAEVPEARSGSRGGHTPDLIVMDEAHAFTAQEMERVPRVTRTPSSHVGTLAQRQALDRVMYAITAMGPSPGYHSYQLRHLRAKWPTLAEALVALMNSNGHAHDIPAEWK